MQPLLSIVIPIYNNERTLKKMVDSILMQKFDNWELLLVDDGATDSCPQIIDDYAKSDNRIKAFHKKNGGTYSGFNFGLEKADGKYIIFVSADDTFEPSAFEIISAQANEYDYDIIFVNSFNHVCDSEQNILKFNDNPTNNMTSPLKVIGKKEVEIHWLLFMHLGLLRNAVNAYKLSILKPHRFREDIFSADTFMNITIADSITSISCHPQNIYNYYFYLFTDDENVNISNGKYYPYVHDMYNEFYLNYKELFASWNLLQAEHIIMLAKWRVSNLQSYLSNISASNNKNTPAENVNIIAEYYDDILFETAAISDNLSTVDNNIYNAIKTIVVDNQTNNFDNPVANLIKTLNSDSINAEEITNSLLDYQNPYRIGFETYKTLSTNYPKIANQAILAYLKTEQTARKQLFTGNLEQALDTTIQLFNSKISTPEQYITLALCGYHLGLTEDAKNAVETGLQNFPNYPRLEELQNIINTERNK
ncbi:MAG: glycosyltransferase family 2 protein [Firmicutes bacterium]|nr:glycosyltransferase family 2 protein [Bacillota bacterium]